MEKTYQLMDTIGRRLWFHSQTQVIRSCRPAKRRHMRILLRIIEKQQINQSNRRTTGYWDYVTTTNPLLNQIDGIEKLPAKVIF